MDYQYPLDYHWSTEEMIDVVRFYEKIEQANEKGIKKEELMASYRRFKEIVPSKAEEKKLDAEFQEISGYSIYRTMQQAKGKVEGETVKL
ncbi:MAG: UPF0223 family protein [Bacillaceae bacterium]